ncbi:BICD family-like cargo adapter 1 isoform X2 [Oncorhynchus mykiss]|uniref:BICD family-like cargo adapter 1 isoform X2 n=1 Tax=Oncorhynchus mykiss TaxID=8022 RepID=UPI0018788DA9|nr:BICD family-like cargo adapter 1 isoform X2 [Oncorhynchus mykiss]
MAMEVERAMTSELQTLKQELQQKGQHNRPQEEEMLSAMREQVVRLSQKEQALEEQLESVCQENADLRDRLASLHTRLALQDQHNQQQSQQLAEAWQEAAAARGRSQQLQVQVEELQEEVYLQDRSNHGNTSLLSELETSLDTMGLGHDREQMTQEVLSILELLRPLIQVVKTPERSEFIGQEEGDLQAMLLQLHGVAQALANHTHIPQISQLQEENAELRLRLGNRQDEEEVAQQAIRDRDEAIAKKNLMEAELVRSKKDMMCLNNQLLEAIQRKLELSQELEAWQDDIQTIINQQLRTQQQSEQVQRKPASNSMSFWRRPSIASSTRPHRPSSSPASWTSEAGQEKPQSPWRDWLRPGKVAQSGK